MKNAKRIFLPVITFMFAPFVGGTAQAQWYNTATGQFALYTNTSKPAATGSYNTADGYQSLYYNDTGSHNTGVGYQALGSNTTGSGNTGTGSEVLALNTTGVENAAFGNSALGNNTSGNYNTATGFYALGQNLTGFSNTADGTQALLVNKTGSQNTAVGVTALSSNSTGDGNTAVGVGALSNNSTGGNNIGIGGGSNITTGSNNIEIGSSGVVGDSATMRLGTQGTQTQTFVAGIFGATSAGGVPVYVTSTGQLGTLTSSARYKQDIHDMGAASDALLSLRPVSFQYKPEIDPKGTPQFGLVAEEVEKVSPELVVHDANHHIYTVRYEAVNAMLLNEFQKQHKTITEQEKTIAEQNKHAQDQDRAIADQKKLLQSLAARLEQVEQAEKKVGTHIPN